MFLHEDSQAYRDAEDARFGKQGGGSIRTPRNDNTMIASFKDFEKIRDGMTVTVITANTPEEKAAQEYRIWKSNQEQADRDWKLEQQLGFNPYKDYDYD
jgi:hypothetical protein